MMSCSIINASGVSFGAYETHATTSLDSTGAVTFRCTGVSPSDVISIQLGRGDADTFLPRAMTCRDSRLDYNLFLDAARTLVWGDGTSGTSAYTLHPIDGQLVSVSIFGRVPPRQNVLPGLYSDVIVLTVLY
jgi:spore coat protein U-like protein